MGNPVSSTPYHSRLFGLSRTVLEHQPEHANRNDRGACCHKCCKALGKLGRSEVRCVTCGGYSNSRNSMQQVLSTFKALPPHCGSFTICCRHMRLNADAST